MVKHAIISASSSHRWLKCVAAPAMESQIPQTTSEYAQEGTFAHNLLSQCLKDKMMEVISLTGQKRTFEGDTRILDKELTSSVQLALDTISSFSGTVLSEVSVPLEPFTSEKEATGTADIIIFAQDHWVIADFKYGAGVAVNVENNSQLMLYALGAYHQYKAQYGEPKTLTLVIIQPRIRLGDPVQEWTLTPQELREKSKHFREQGKKALALMGKKTIPLASYGVDETACRFCRAKPRCEALALKALSSFSENQQILNNHQLSKVMSVLPLIETWVKGVKDEAFNVLSSGEELPNYELKEGRKGSRTYLDDIQVEQLLMRELGDGAYNRTLLSPTETEQLVKKKKVSEATWEQLQEFITRKEGKKVIVPRDFPVNHHKANISEFKVLKD